MVFSFVLYQVLIRTLGPSLGTPSVSPPTAALALTPVQSADPKTKHLKSFRIRRSEKTGGAGGKLLTSRATSDQKGKTLAHSAAVSLKIASQRKMIRT